MDQGLIAEKTKVLEAANQAAHRLDMPVEEFLRDLVRLEDKMTGQDLDQKAEAIADAALSTSAVDEAVFIGVTSRIDIQHVMRLTTHVDRAALLLGLAFAQGGVADFRPPKRKGPTTSEHTSAGWYAAIVNATLGRLQDVREALGHKWSPSVEVAPLVQAAFLLLADLTPARPQLQQLARTDRQRAFDLLRTHLDLLREQFLLTVQLVADIEARPAPASPDIARFEKVRDDLLAKAGELLTLTEAADRLNVSRQALHQRIQKGTAIGIMRGRDLVVPAIQFVSTRDGEVIVPRLQDAVQPFLKAERGALTALQFLLRVDPNLGVTPLEALKANRPEDAHRAALAYLD